MALKTNALVTLEEAKSWLAAGTGDEAKLEEEINRASDFLEGPHGFNRPLKERTKTFRLPGPKGPVLALHLAPVKLTDPVAVTIGTTVKTVWRTESDGAQDTKDVLVRGFDPVDPYMPTDQLWCAGGWGSSTTYNPDNVLLTYTGGFNPIPDEMKGACFWVLQKFWRDRQKGLADVTTVSGPFGSVNILDAMPRVLRCFIDRYRWQAI